MRRFHNKSKLGCSQCKKRRVKCDEARPACQRCSHANLACSFQTDVNTITAKTCGSKGPPPVAIFKPLPHTAPAANPAPPGLDAALENRFGGFHIRLMHYFEHDYRDHELDLHPGLDDLMALFIANSWTTPYLLDEVLAYAAAHMSRFDRQKRELCLYEAKRLQTRALTQYNRQSPMLGDKTCMPMFLYAGLLSHHIIFELSLSAQNDLPTALEALTQSIRIHRGLVAISQEAWPLFSETDRQKFTVTCLHDLPIPESQNTLEECNLLLARLDRASHLDALSRRVYPETVQLLQARFELLKLNDTRSMWGAIQDWLVAIPTGYVELLRQMQPEALVILAHFGVLLHHGAEHWFVGDTGVRLVRLVDEHLGPRWSKWLEWPNRIIMKEIWS